MRGLLRVLAVTAFLASLTIGIVGSAPLHAQDWPTRPIKLLVGFGAGGGTDIAARLVGQGLSEILGQPVVVENRVGAGGMTAADAVAKTPKDGSMALMMSNAHTISAVMYKTLRYDPVNDFEMVSMVATAGLALVTRPDFPAKDLAGTVAVIKASPGKFNFGSAGAGTTQQFSGELMKQIAGLDMRHVPYRSTPAVLAGLLSGDVEMVFELIQTFAESGMPGCDVTSWYGVALPAGTPPAIVQKMNKAMVDVLARDSVRDQT